jgi:hypothetical protein
MPRVVDEMQTDTQTTNNNSVSATKGSNEMAARSDTSSILRDVDQRAAMLAAIVLLRVAEQEWKGLSPRNAVLAAASELGIDPARVLDYVKKVKA